LDESGWNGVYFILIMGREGIVFVLSFVHAPREVYSLLVDVWMGN
jgi:hypothetical protein